MELFSIRIQRTFQLVSTTDLGNIANTKFIWEITPLPSPKTNARCLYEIVPLHIQNEMQVNFKRNTKFHIDKSNNIPILKVHEIE